MDKQYKHRCEGWTKAGNFMTLGPREWKQCENEGIVVLTFKYSDSTEEQSLPACAQCWADLKKQEESKEVKIKSATPIVEEA